MDWQWLSRKGNDRKTNNDAAAVVSKQRYLFAIVVDAAEKGGNGESLAQFWADHTAKKLVSFDMPSCEQVITVMRENQKSLREGYLCDIASYSALLLHHQSRSAWGIHCGDSRLGICRTGELIWHSNPHTWVNVRGEEFREQDCVNSDRHLLTRSLNAKRFAMPDIQLIDWQEGDAWILASDGYWADHLGRKIPQNDLEDDASYLEIAEQQISTRQMNDFNNFFAYRD